MIRLNEIINIQVSPSAQPPYPLLIAIHGNGFSPAHSAQEWVCAMRVGWLVFHPMAKRLEHPPMVLRGMILYTPYDYQRAGDVNQILEMMQAAGIEIRLEKYPAEGHVFLEDFPERFNKAVDYVLRLTT
jgi:pimeloyl-ACP methyl ester carboxylesterase